MHGLHIYLFQDRGIDGWGNGEGDQVAVESDCARCKVSCGGTFTVYGGFPIPLFLIFPTLALRKMREGRAPVVLAVRRRSKAGPAPVRYLR